MYYRVSFRCDDRDPLQMELDRLYDYADDIETRVLHRLRLNLFFQLLRELIDRRVVTRFESALDVGCNAGVYSKILSDFGFRRVDGIDIDEGHIARAQVPSPSPRPSARSSSTWRTPRRWTPRVATTSSCAPR